MHLLSLYFLNNCISYVTVLHILKIISSFPTQHVFIRIFPAGSFCFYYEWRNFKRTTYTKAMYKTNNTGTGNGMRGTQGMGGMLYSGECHQTFRGMSSNIPGNVLKHSGECPQTFWGISPNIPENVLKYSGECRQTFRGMSLNISGNVPKHSGECRRITIVNC